MRFCIGAAEQHHADAVDAYNWSAWGMGTIEDVVSSQNYKYSVSSAVASEGSKATFTISRDGSDQTSSVYFNTSAYDATLGVDFQHLQALKIDFAVGETTKTVDVEIYSDNDTTEGTEYFYADLYSNAESALAAGSDYIDWNWGTIEDI